MTNQIDSFLNMMRAEVGASANTIDAYRRDLEQFEALCRFQDYNCLLYTSDAADE